MLYTLFDVFGTRGNETNAITDSYFFDSRAYSTLATQGTNRKSDRLVFEVREIRKREKLRIGNSDTIIHDRYVLCNWI